MATRPKSMAQALELGTRTALRDNPVQSITIYRRIGATPLGRHSLGPAHRVSPIATMPNFAPAMRRPSVQPSTSPPIRRISAAPAVAKFAAQAPRAAISCPVAVSAVATKSASMIGRLSMPISAPQARTASIPLPRMQAIRPVPLPTSPHVSLAPRPAMQAEMGQSVWKKTFLAAVPGFFGLMGLSQLYQGRKLVGFSFLASGALISFLSSWYIILFGRIGSFVFKGAQPSAYALTFLSSVGGNAEVGSKIAMDLLGLLIVVWGLSVYDALGSVFVEEAQPLRPSSRKRVLRRGSRCHRLDRRGPRLRPPLQRMPRLLVRFSDK